MSLVRKTKKVTVETIPKQLEYVTKGHIATYTILFFLNLKWLYFLVPFSSLVLLLFLNNILQPKPGLL